MTIHASIVCRMQVGVRSFHVLITIIPCRLEEIKTV